MYGFGFCKYQKQKNYIYNKKKYNKNYVFALHAICYTSYPMTL